MRARTHKTVSRSDHALSFYKFTIYLHFLTKKKEKRITIQPILEMIFLDVIPWQTFQEGKIIFLQEVPLHIFAFLELHNSLIKVVIARPTLLGNAFP